MILDGTATLRYWSIYLAFGFLIVCARHGRKKKKNLTGVQGKAMKMIKGLFALIYEDMLNEFSMNNSPK